MLENSPFCGEGYRKVRACLRREQGIATSGKRVVRLMRRAGLLAPQRARRRRTPRPHDGTIIPAGPNLRWGADGTMAYTRDDGWVWVFVCVDHFTAEARAHVSASGDRPTALQPVYDAVLDRWGQLRADTGRGLALRHDWGPQYRSAHFLGSLRWLGIGDDASYVGEPECNGCAERWIKTLKEQCLWARLYDDVDDLRQAVATFVSTYQQPVAHPAPRTPDTEGEVPRQPHLRGGVIVMATVQRTGGSAGDSSRFRRAPRGPKLRSRRLVSTATR